MLDAIFRNLVNRLREWQHNSAVLKGVPGAAESISLAGLRRSEHLRWAEVGRGALERAMALRCN